MHARESVLHNDSPFAIYIKYARAKVCYKLWHSLKTRSAGVDKLDNNNNNSRSNSGTLIASVV